MTFCILLRNKSSKYSDLLTLSEVTRWSWSNQTQFNKSCYGSNSLMYENCAFIKVKKFSLVFPFIWTTRYINAKYTNITMVSFRPFTLFLYYLVKLFYLKSKSYSLYTRCSGPNTEEVTSSWTMTPSTKPVSASRTDALLSRRARSK